MKKISFLMALPLVMGATFTSCVEDTQPRLEQPTEFVLNTPMNADQTIVFRDDENYNNLNSITFTVSQPNYGLGVTPTYTVQLAKSQADFDAWDAAEKTGDTDTDNTIVGADGLPLAYTLPTQSTSAVIEIAGNEFCDGMNALYGFDLDNYNGETEPVSVRVHAALQNAPYSEIWSNTLNLNVSGYIPVTEPGKLYLIGQPTGWAIDADQVYLEETGIGTKLFTGKVYVGAGEFQFRFYSQLNDWDSWSVGAADADSPVDISFTDGHYEGPIFMSAGGKDAKGKGSWQDTGWTGGYLNITINTKEKTIKMDVDNEEPKLFIVGSFTGWDIASTDYTLAETEPNSNIFTGTIENLEAGSIEFAIFTALGDWDKNYVGPGGSFSIAAGPFTANTNDAKGNWKDENFPGGNLTITVDLNSNTILFEQ